MSAACDTPLRVGIVGCGAIAGNHAAAFGSQPGVVLTGCTDVDPDRARDFAARHGVASVFDSLGEMLAFGVDVVSVCTPHQVHEEAVIEAAAAGAHVLCEKPLAAEVAAAERMVSACRSAGVTFGTVFQRRFWPAAQRIRAALDDGTVGEPMLARVEVLLHRDRSYYTDAPWRGDWSSGGGVVMTQAIHYLDLLQWYLGEVEWVMAASDRFVHGDVIEVEDTLAATLRFTNGAIGQFTASTALSPGHGERIAVTGRNGATVGLLEYPEGQEAITDVWTVPGDARYDFPTRVLPDAELSDVHAALTPFHTLQIAEFVEAVRAGKEPAVTGADALRSLRTMAAMYASAASGEPVRLEAPNQEDSA